ncbi:MAG: hypothetical protein IJP82_07890 [Bacteroidaceae bacterium]|nr:hypothetical protein [Bacteroidaceae bacterium]
MKKSLLLLASLVVSVAASAQWTKPVPSSTVDMDDSGTAAQFLYNKEAAGFFAGANDWNTRASAATWGDSIRLVKLDEAWNLMCYPSAANKGAWLYVSCNNFDAMWVDAPNATENESYPGTDKWVVEKQSNGSYKFSNTAVEADPGFMGVAEIYQGQTGNTRVYIHDSKAEYTYTENEEDVVGPSFTGAFYDEWYFITVEEYEALQPKVAAYQAAVSLKAALDAAKAEYPSLDFSAPESVYNNTSSSAEALAEAEEQVASIINEYKSNLASFDEPYDYVDVIGDGSSVTPWTRDFTGTGEVGTHTTNTWSTEANNGADGTDMTTPFCEHWTASGGILSDQKIYQKLSALPAGLYKFTADVRVYSEAGQLEKFEGAYMYFGDEKINMQDEVDIYYSGSKSVLWSKDYFTIIAIVKESQDIEFGFEIKDANFNWIAFKNTSLLYYGNKDVEANAVKLLKAAYSFEKADEDLAANAGVIEAYNDAVDAFNAATEADEIKATAAAASAAQKALTENISAYETLYAKFIEWEKNLIANSSLAGPEWDDFCDFIQSEDDIEGYPSPVPTVMKEEADYPLTTSEIEEYISTVDALYAHAVAVSLVPGADCTSMLVNPDFGSSSSVEKEDGTWSQGTYNTTGWTGSAALGGLNEYMGAERYDTTVDFYQTVKDAPAGIYKIETHAFVRPAANGSYSGDEEINCWLYMNDFRTTVQHILTDALPADDAIDQENCYLSEATSGSFWPASTWSTGYDYLYTGTELPNGAYSATGFYVPNCMVGASVAFKAGRYPVTTYGLVGDGEDMKIGITSDGQKVHWFLFSGFKLTFEGKTSEAIFNILPKYIEDLQDYLAINDGAMTKAAADAADLVASSAAELKVTDSADDLWDALQSVNAALVDARANVVAFSALFAAIDEMNLAAENDEIAHSAEALALYNDILDDIDTDAIDELDTEGVIALTELVKEVTVALNIPDVSDASDDNPADFTSVIVNSTFDTVGDFTGWSDGFGAGGTTSTNAECYNKTFDVYQDIVGLPAGTYEVGVQGYYRQGSAEQDYTNTQTEDGTPAYNTIIYAIGENADTCCAPIMSICAAMLEYAPGNGATVTVGDGYVVPNTMAAATEWFDALDDEGEPAGYYAPDGQFNSAVVRVGDDGKLRIGVKKDVTISTDWAIFDNFTLTYYGANSAKTPSYPTIIENVATAKTVAPAGIYTITGAKVATLQKGINIIRMENGQVKKVFIK